MSDTFVADLRRQAQIAANYPPRIKTTLRGLARKAGVSPAVLMRFLKGGNMRSDNLEKLERALDPFQEPDVKEGEGEENGRTDAL